MLVYLCFFNVDPYHFQVGTSRNLEVLSVSVACMTSLSDPIIYAAVNPQFRTEFFRLKRKFKSLWKKRWIQTHKHSQNISVCQPNEKPKACFHSFHVSVMPLGVSHHQRENWIASAKPILKWAERHHTFLAVNKHSWGVARCETSMDQNKNG